MYLNPLINTKIRCHKGYATSNFPCLPGHSNVVQRLIVCPGNKLLFSRSTGTLLPKAIELNSQ